MRARVPAVRQRDISDCGAACLASVAAFHGRGVPVARLRQLAGTNQRGTSLLGLVRAAERVGLESRGVRATPDALARLPLPAIVHVVQDGELHHYYVLTAVRGDAIEVMDPARGEHRRLARAAFLAEWSGAVLLLAPGAAFVAREERTPALVRLWRLVQPHRRLLAEALVGAAAATALALGVSVYVQQLVDRVLVGGHTRLLALLTVGAVVLSALQLLLTVLKDHLVLETGQRIDATLVLGYYRHLLRLPQRFFDSMRVGELTSRIGDAVKIRAFVNDVAVDLLVNLMTVGFCVAFLAFVSWRLALLALLAVPLYGLLFWATNALNRRAQRRLMESAADLEAQMVESITAIGTIRRFGLGPRHEARAEQLFVTLMDRVWGAARLGIGAAAGTEAVARLLTVAVLWLGASLVLARELSMGQMLSAYAIIGYLTGPIGMLVTSTRAVQEALVAADRLFEVLDLEPEPGTEGLELGASLAGDLVLDRVTFAYDARTPALCDVSATFPRGQVTLVAGESGSGKSTLAHLLQRVYEPTGGTIRLGAHQIASLRLDALRRHVGVVPQEVTLFSGTVAENIILGEAGDVDDERLVEVVGRLGLLPFIESLPQGFATPVGERGAQLSGGQRQRLAIARALYRKPSVLVLDEATSALDAHAERAVLDTIRQFRAEGGTVIMIAHRLSMAAIADRVLVMDGGRVVEEGSPAELWHRDGAYRRLWDAQYPAPPLARTA